MVFICVLQQRVDKTGFELLVMVHNDDLNGGWPIRYGNKYKKTYQLFLKNFEQYDNRTTTKTREKPALYTRNLWF